MVCALRLILRIINLNLKKNRCQKYQFLKLSKDLAEFPWVNMPAIFYTEVVSISVQSKLALSSEPRRMNTH